jgi:hypothetical protein
VGQRQRQTKGFFVLRYELGTSIQPVGLVSSKNEGKVSLAAS